MIIKEQPKILFYEIEQSLIVYPLHIYNMLLISNLVNDEFRARDCFNVLT